MISVVLALYNGEKYILEQLESIKNQSVAADEVLIVDDGSSDSSIHLVEQFIARNELKNWRCIINEYNKGYAKNFYDAMKIAVGDFILFSDQDDVWEISKIEKTTNILKSNDAVSAVISAIEFVDEKLVHLNKNFFQCNNNSRYLTPKEIITNCSYMGCAITVRKKALSDIFWNTNNLVAHDWALVLDLIFSGKIYYLGESTLKHRIHAENASIVRLSSKKLTRINELEKMEIHYKWALGYCSQLGVDDNEKKLLSELKDFYEKRKEAVTKNDLILKLKLIAMIRIYLNVYGSIRALVGDMIY